MRVSWPPAISRTCSAVRPAWNAARSERTDAIIVVPYGMWLPNRICPGGARMQLDPAGATTQSTLGLAKRVVRRVETAERNEPPVRRGGLLDHAVVGRRVAVRLVHREDHCPRVRQLEPGRQLLGAAAEAV